MLAPPSSDDPPPPPHYLVSACGADGRFTYRVNTHPAVTPAPRYNMLRHAGAIYALAQYEVFAPAEPTRAAIRRAVDYLCAAALQPVGDSGAMAAIWTDPVLTGDSRARRAKLGGAALGLTALISAERVAPGAGRRADWARLGQFLLYMQKTDGSFYSRYLPEHGGRCDAWTSLYYPGEAILALTLLGEEDADGPWRAAARRGLLALERGRRGAPDVPADHWALLATAAWLRTAGPACAPDTRAAMRRHAAQVCRSILDAAPRDGDGRLTADGRTCPTATRVEGLQAALAVLPETESDLRARVAKAVRGGVRFLAAAQLRDGPYAGGVPRAVTRFSEHAPAYDAGFNRRATEIRIDYVQHALSAILPNAAAQR
jgi:hypothetical protein